MKAYLLTFSNLNLTFQKELSKHKHSSILSKTIHCYLTLMILLITGLVSFSQEMIVGLTSTGGPSDGGTAFSVKTSGSNFTVVHKFMRAGGYPNGDLLKASDGSFYGMMSRGGTNNYGTIFKVTSTGTLTVLKNLDRTTGTSPFGSLVEGSEGNFYGMTNSGGSFGYGTIFKISSTGVHTVLKHLEYTTSGGAPYGSLIKGSDANFYGMTYQGSSNNTYAGTIFKITPTGTFTVLKNLDNSTGRNPRGSLVQGSDGNFYGMTSAGEA